MNREPASDGLPPSERAEAAAAAWLSLRDRGMSAVETEEFMRWLQEDPRHAAVFAELDAVWRDCDRLAAVPAAGTPADAEMLAPRTRPRRRGWPAWAAAAAIVTLAAWFTLPAPPTAETSVGAFQKLDLPDGSVAQLNTDSAIEIDFGSAERRVRIMRGEVFFAVARDAARPFVVQADAVVIRAVGTAFNVRRRDSAVEVLVTEGRVRLGDPGTARGAAVNQEAVPPARATATLLAAGERTRVPLRVTAAQPVTVEHVSEAAIRRALAWQERRLEFENTPLAEVVAEFNRYNRTQLLIADERLAGRRFSGTFRADGYESLVRLLQENFGVVVGRADDEIVLQVGR